MSKHVIWSNYSISPNLLEYDEEMSDEVRYHLAEEENYYYLEEERSNFSTKQNCPNMKTRDIH